AWAPGARPAARRQAPGARRGARAAVALPCLWGGDHGGAEGRRTSAALRRGSDGARNRLVGGRHAGSKDSRKRRRHWAARGRMGHAAPLERFWRTLREQCLDLTGSLGSLHDLNARLLAWVDERYHVTPHGALVGKTPLEVFAAAETTDRDAIDEVRLRAALTVRARRRVRRDNTLSMDGENWETELHFLAGQLVTVARCLALPDDPPWLEHEN